MHKYHIQDREDYHKYNKLCGSLRSLIHRISLLPANDPFRQQKEGEMLNKLYDMGILGAWHAGAGRRCKDPADGRRWLQAVGYREQGHGVEHCAEATGCCCYAVEAL